MPVRKGLLAPKNTFLDTVAIRFDGTRVLDHNANHLDISFRPEWQSLPRGVLTLQYEQAALQTLKGILKEMRGDVSLHLHREILSLPIFESASKECLKLLPLHIRNSFCASRKFLVHKRDALTDIHNIGTGSMKVI